MADISDLLSTLMSGGAQPSAQPQPVASGVQNSGVQALNQQISGGNILARLRNAAPGAGTGGGILGTGIGSAGGGIANLKTNGSKFGAFAQGIGAGLDARAAQNAALMKAQWDMSVKREELKQKQAELDETKRAHDQLGKYYDGLIKNGADKNNKDSTDTVNDTYKTELARGQAALRFGLRDPTLNKAANDPTLSDTERQAAQGELARRQKMFDAWDGQQSWSKKGSKSTAVPGATPAASGDDDESDDTATPAAANPSASPDIPTPPARPADIGADPAPATAGSWNTIRNPKTGESMRWNNATGETKPLDGTASANPGTPATPSLIAPPTGFAGDDALPAS